MKSLIGQVATLSSVYHKPPEAFVVRRAAGIGNDEDDDDDDDDEDYEGGGDGDLLDMAGGLGISDSGGGMVSNVFSPPHSSMVPVFKIYQICSSFISFFFNILV